MKYQVNFRTISNLIFHMCENNMLSSHGKISILLWLHNKSRLAHQKTIKVKWFRISLVYIIEIEHYMAAWRYEYSLLVLKKYFTRSLRTLVKYFSTLQEKFRISARPCNILYLFYNRLYIIDTLSCYYFIIWFVATLQTAKSVEIMYVTSFHSYQALSPLSVCWLLCCSKRHKQIAREMVSDALFLK